MTLMMVLCPEMVKVEASVVNIFTMRAVVALSVGQVFGVSRLSNTGAQRCAGYR
jgi:hypothetical protein